MAGSDARPLSRYGFISRGGRGERGGDRGELRVGVCVCRDLSVDG